MKQVLKIRYHAFGKEEFAYVQQVTEKLVVTITDEETTRQWRREDGFPRNYNLSSCLTFIKSLENINEFVLKTCQGDRWHGNWKPAINSRGEVVNEKMPSFSRFYGDREGWLKSQGVQIIDITDGVSKIKKHRTPHPFEYQGVVYDGPIKVKVSDSDDELSIQQRIEIAKEKFGREYLSQYGLDRTKLEATARAEGFKLRGHTSVAESKGKARREARERRGK